MAVIRNKANIYTTEYNASVKGKFTILTNSDKNKLHLQINNLRKEGSPMYYSMKDTVSGLEVDLWLSGKGPLPVALCV
jgi:immunoglobulin heavy chain